MDRVLAYVEPNGIALRLQCWRSLVWSTLNSLLSSVGGVLHFLTLVIFVGVFVDRIIAGHECGRCFSIDFIIRKQGTKQGCTFWSKFVFRSISRNERKMLVLRKMQSPAQGRNDGGQGWRNSPGAE